MRLLWYYDKDDLNNQVEKAVKRYRRKYGYIPTRLLLHTGTDITDSLLAVAVGMKIAEDHTVIPQHFVLEGEENIEDQDREDNQPS